MDKQEKLAFIRKCDKCKVVTAIDLDPTEEHWKEMCFYGQTIYTVSESQAIEEWKTARKCECKN